MGIRDFFRAAGEHLNDILNLGLPYTGDKAFSAQDPSVELGIVREIEYREEWVSLGVSHVSPVDYAATTRVSSVTIEDAEGQFVKYKPTDVLSELAAQRRLAMPWASPVQEA